jgi:hypothetical protein
MERCCSALACWSCRGSLLKWSVRRNLDAKLPEALPLFEEFLRSVPLQIYRPTPYDRERARELADAKDVPILARPSAQGRPFS